MVYYFWFFIAILLLLAVLCIGLPGIGGVVRKGSSTSKFCKKNLWINVLLVMFVVSFSLTAYWHWGESEKLIRYWRLENNAQAAKKILAKVSSPQQVVDALLARLKQEPNSAKGWYLLGRLYLSMTKPVLASQAFAKAYRLQVSNDDYATAYAEALFFANHKQLSLEAKQILQTVLLHAQNNVLAKNLLAIDAFNHQQYHIAIQYWESLLMQFPQGSRDQQLLLKMIGRAQKKLTEQ